MTDGPASFNYPDPSPDRTHTNPFTGKPVAPMTNTTPTTPHRATPEQWAQIERWAAREAMQSSAILELRARVEALEVDANEDSASTHFCFDSIFKRLEALEAGATCPHVVTSDEGTSYCGLAEQTARIGQSDVPADTSAQTSQSTPNDRQIRSSLLERVGRAISLDAWGDAGNWAPEACAAIRAVAEWLRSQDLSTGDYWAGRLEQETER